MTGADVTKGSSRPRFEDLPLSPNDPPYSAWGLWGTSDELGSLNTLTPAVLRRAALEIVSGQTIALRSVSVRQ